MPNSEYIEVTNWLFYQFPSYQKIGSKAYKPTLDNVIKLLDFIGNPQNDLKFVHIAGSNGKGSVSSIIASSLTEYGYKVGLFTSPHILDYSERIRINGTPIDQQAVIDFVNKIKSKNFDFAPSFFEVTFALTLLHFKNNNCDICIIETGLGGRLDATNVIQSLISVITTISLEHTEILGNTIQEIAKEKAGIIKLNTEVVVGNILPDALTVIQQVADEKKSQITFSEASPLPNFSTSFFIADYQFENLKTAITVLNKLKQFDFKSTFSHIKKGLIRLKKNTGYYGRLELISDQPKVFFDVSHNADGIKTTLKSIQKITKGKIHIIFGASSDKDLKLIKTVLPLNASYYFTEFDHLRSAKIKDLKTEFGTINLESAHYFNEAKIAYHTALSNSLDQDTLLVIGSFFLLQEFY